MPVRKLGGIIRSLNDVRRGLSKRVPAEIDALLADVITAVGQLPGMPLEERRDFAQKQRDQLDTIRGALLGAGEGSALAMAETGSLPDVVGAIDGAMDALADVVSGIDINIPL